MLTRILTGGLVASLVANATLAFLLERHKAAWATERAEIAASVATALRSHQERSDAVTKSSAERAEKAEANLRNFEHSQFANREDPVYTEWADTKLPPGVAERLGALNGP